MEQQYEEEYQEPVEHNKTITQFTDRIPPMLWSYICSYAGVMKLNPENKNYIKTRDYSLDYCRYCKSRTICYRGKVEGE